MTLLCKTNRKRTQPWLGNLLFTDCNWPSTKKCLSACYPWPCPYGKIQFFPTKNGQFWSAVFFIHPRLFWPFYVPTTVLHYTGNILFRSVSKRTRSGSIVKWKPWEIYWGGGGGWINTMDKQDTDIFTLSQIQYMEGGGGWINTIQDTDIFYTVPKMVWIKTEPATVQILYTFVTTKPYTYHCIRSIQNRFSFYAEIIFGSM